MNVNLLSLAQDALGGNFSQLAGQFLGESPAATQSALGALLPAVLGTIARKGATPQGATGLMSLIKGAELDTSSLSNVGGLFGGGGAGISALLKSGTNHLVPALLGDQGGAVVNALSSASGIKTSSATSLLAMVVPLVLTVLKKFIADKGLNEGALSSLLASQGPNLSGALNSRMTQALGFASPAAFLGGLGGQAMETAQRASAAVTGGAAAATTAAKSGMTRWLPWVIVAAVLLFVWNRLSDKQTPLPPTSEPAPAAMPAAEASAPLAKVYFDVGSATVGTDGATAIAGVADMVKKDNLMVSVTGYTDRTGDMTQNETLAKNRAFAVRDALKAAGVAEALIEMKPPMAVEIGSAGAEAEARRVDISRR